MSAEVSAALALALGKPVDGWELSWPIVLRVARQERCAALGWLRSAAAIRRLAPPDVAANWRAEMMSAISLAEFWRLTVVETLSRLTADGVNAVVLKGLPLSQRLYGDAAARPCADIDLYIPPAQREAADRALVDMGWRCRIGRAPGEAGYTTERGARTVILEVHSALLDDQLVAHLPFAAPGARTVDLGGAQVAAHDDAQLPAYLATHLAKHAMPPLLWFVDFHALWSELSREEREAAWVAAEVAHARRFLSWAVDRSNDVAAAASSEPAALERLGIQATGRVDGHAAVRVARLSAGPVDALRVVAGWLIPTPAVGEWAEVRRLLIGRLRKMGAGTLGRNRSYGDIRRPSSQPSPSRRAIVFEAEDFHAVVSELSRRDARFAIRASGRSMQPSLPEGTLVMLTPRGAQQVRVGDVVLVRTERGRYVLHRVQTVGSGSVRTQGDANMCPDLPVPIESVVAIAESMLVDGKERGIPAGRIVRTRRLVARGLRLLGRRAAHGRDPAAGGTLSGARGAR